MHRNVAHPTEYNKVFILVISVVANRALSVFLYNKTTLVSAQLLWFYTVISFYFQRLLLKNHLVCDIIFFLLPQFELSQEFFFSSWGVINVQQNLRNILDVPVIVVAYIVHVLWINNRMFFPLVISRRKGLFKDNFEILVDLMAGIIVI
jgi:hypothetical protein